MPPRLLAALGRPAAIVLGVLAAWHAPAIGAAESPKASSFTLGNGMQVVVIPDHRAPVVTHMVWYRVGAADDPQGRSGLAHFLEHLMFKATAKIKSGEFTRALNRLGARHNALTTHDTTSYFQRAAKEHLGRLMELEADRMTNLKLDVEEVRTERDVIKEERRSSIDASPVAMLNEQMLSVLFQNHPYRRPVLGWAHEIERLEQSDAAAFYKAHYAPNNAVLVIAGDVTEGEVRQLAEKSYGRNERSAAIKPRMRPSEPEQIAPRRITLEDQRAGEPLVLRYYHAPSFQSGAREAAPVTVLARIMGGDDTSRLYRRLVVETKLAVQAGADHQNAQRDSGRIALLALAAKGRAMQEIEAAIDAVIAEIRKDGVTEEELRRAKRGLEADHVFETDNQEKRARRYGDGLTAGRSLAEVEGDQALLQAVSVGDVRRAAETYLDLRRSVTGLLVKPAAGNR